MLSLCSSRACLGKMFVFEYKNGPKVAFSHLRMSRIEPCSVIGAVQIIRAPCRKQTKTSDVVFPTFMVFVRSLSWQIFGFQCTTMALRRRFPAAHPIQPQRRHHARYSSWLLQQHQSSLGKRVLAARHSLGRTQPTHHLFLSFRYVFVPSLSR